MLIEAKPEEWHMRMACAVPGVDPEIFTPKRRKSGRPRKGIAPSPKGRDWTEAEDMCARCPVTVRCLADALDQPKEPGDPYYLFQAGLTPEELTELRRRGWTGARVMMRGEKK